MCHLCFACLLACLLFFHSFILYSFLFLFPLLCSFLPSCLFSVSFFLRATLSLVPRCRLHFSLMLVVSLSVRLGNHQGLSHLPNVHSYSSSVQLCSCAGLVLSSDPLLLGSTDGLGKRLVSAKHRKVMTGCDFQFYCSFSLFI